jgi:hypothetical protein
MGKKQPAEKPVPKIMPDLSGFSKNASGAGAQAETKAPPQKPDAPKP